jgi:hypothetical protein
MNENLKESEELEDDDNWEENEKWECYLCAIEEKFSIFPDGYIANSHSLCGKCADEVLYNEDHEDRVRLTYHSSIGDLKMVANIPIQENFAKKN